MLPQDSDAIYPEYVVLYSRVHHADSESKIEKLTKDLKLGDIYLAVH